MKYINKKIMNIIFLIYVITSLAFIGTSIPLIQNKVPLNKWYGFRTKKTMRDEKIWYEANRYFGKLLLVIGCVCLFTTITLYYFTDLSEDSYTLIMAALILAGFGLVLLISNFKLKGLK